MTHTQNYNLNQWDADDSILREDFNEDNRKLDAALGGLASRTGLVLLNEITVETASNRILIPLALDWTEWKIIHIDVFPTDGSSPNMYFCGSFSSHDKVAPMPTTRCHIMMLPMGRADTLFTTLVWGKAQTCDQRNYSYRICTQGVSFQSGNAED